MGSTDPTGPVYKHMKPPGPHFDLDNTLVHIQILQNNRVQVLCKELRRALTRRLPGTPATAPPPDSTSIAYSIRVPSLGFHQAAQLCCRRLAGKPPETPLQDAAVCSLLSTTQDPPTLRLR